MSATRLDGIVTRDEIFDDLAVRVQRLKAAGIEFLAQNVRTTDFGDEVFKPWVMRQVNGVPVAIMSTVTAMRGL